MSLLPAAHSAATMPPTAVKAPLAGLARGRSPLSRGHCLVGSAVPGRNFRVGVANSAADVDGDASADQSTPRRQLLCSTAALAVLWAGGMTAPPAEAKIGDRVIQPFLQRSGFDGPLAQEEADLLELRLTKERLAEEELERVRQELELEARTYGGPGNALCATPFGVDVVGITEFIALLGAVTGGVTSRQRKKEVERLNNQLRAINNQLRQQARAGTTYAPGLTYAPASVTTGAAPAADTSESVDPVAERVAKGIKTGISTEDAGPVSKEQEEVSRTLKEGKRFLKEKNGPAAMVRFEKALMLSRASGQKLAQRRAYRGLAAAERLQGQSKAAIKHLLVVLELSRELGNNQGDADAYGSIADLYTDLGDYDQAAKYYDLYITEMRKAAGAPSPKQGSA